VQNDYLRQSRHTMLASDQPVTLVIGNEAADLDSCVRLPFPCVASSPLPRRCVRR
jgi:hypothetical protein